MNRLGVSPAFVLSRHGTSFSVGDCCASIPAIRELGFRVFQPEIYLADSLVEWEAGGARSIAAVARGAGVRASQFVAHFLMDGFSSARRLADRSDLDPLARALECARAFEDCDVFTVPLAPFRSTAADPPYDELHRLLVAKVRSYHEHVSLAHRRLALEVLPFSLVGNSDGFLRLAAEIGSASLGMNVDTGHARTSGELVELLPHKLAGRIFGLHLKHLRGDADDSRAPGRRLIPWRLFLANLAATGYRGSLDIEIRCAAGSVAERYAAARALLALLQSA